MAEGLLRLNRVIGAATDHELAPRLHDLEHRGLVELVEIGGSDIARHRLQVTTDRGTACAIAIPRAQRLANGAVLLLEPDRAIVVRLAEQQYLALAPGDAAAALELGYLAGNMHWPVRFSGPVLRIVLNGPVDAYLERLQLLMQAGRVRRLDDDE